MSEHVTSVQCDLVGKQVYVRCEAGWRPATVHAFVPYYNYFLISFENEILTVDIKNVRLAP